MRGPFANVLRAMALPLGLVVLAEALGRLSATQSNTLAIPSQVIASFAAAIIDGSILSATLETLITVFSGAVIGCTVGLFLGIVLGLMKPVDRLLGVTIEIVRPIPSVALIPVVVLISGLGYATEISVVTFGCLWPTFVLSRAAVRSVEPRLLEVADALGLSWRQRAWKIVLPAITRQVFVAFRLAAGFALIIAVTVEITTNPLGVGFSMVLAQNALDPARTLAFLIWIGFLGWALSRLLVWIETLLFKDNLAGAQAR